MLSDMLPIRRNNNNNNRQTDRQTDRQVDKVIKQLTTSQQGTTTVHKQSSHPMEYIDQCTVPYTGCTPVVFRWETLRQQHQ